MEIRNPRRSNKSLPSFAAFPAPSRATALDGVFFVGGMRKQGNLCRSFLS